MTEPLPCPFCGDTSGEVAETSTFRWRAWFCSCGVVGPEIRIQTLGEGTKEEWEAQAREDAIVAWNTRPAVQPSVRQCTHWWTNAPNPADVECKVCGVKRTTDNQSKDTSND